MFESLFSQGDFFSTYLSGSTALLIAAFTSIISVANPLAAMPVFISLTERSTDIERITIAQKASFYMLLILLLFLWAGTYIMSFFGISLPGIRIAGGLIILRAAYSMLNPEQSDRKISKKAQEAAKGKEDVSFSPMANAYALRSGQHSRRYRPGLAGRRIC